MSCPACGNQLKIDPDGGWCDNCETYWDKYDLEEKWEEDELDDEEEEGEAG